MVKIEKTKQSAEEIAAVSASERGCSGRRKRETNALNGNNGRLKPSERVAPGGVVPSGQRL